uniref:Uncharacterized protein n=1 Tax=Candidatus Kentrum sp. SD TaxID=2126332 RepID=A0A450Y8M3_9GAMM|nr:MAG: hypothetical protein BECKSD772F_GA0070984_101831 [Candidatus Kentron sp. SD]VFK42512.1 MAG: hypothetical protein BECKSD772E_GA0070983_101731 [Candidatus Kentron sp. SD]VFK78162.1 MAG: hypothetical protein BECKSD772D_GA0070982_100829 [Candidatus Kentron sp. SD]
MDGKVVKNVDFTAPRAAVAPFSTASSHWRTSWRFAPGRKGDGPWFARRSPKVFFPIPESDESEKRILAVRKSGMGFSAIRMDLSSSVHPLLPLPR